MSAAGVHVVALATLAATLDVSPAGAQTSFARDILPIVEASCVPCHREGGDAPFPLTTAETVRMRSATIGAVVARRYMPPWKPEPGVGAFADDARLSDEAVAAVQRWVDDGARLDVAPDTRLGPTTIASLDPAPDVVLQLPTYRLRADGPDVFRNFVVPVPLASRRYVRGLVFRPRGPAVHHANIRVDPTRASRQLDEADPDAGYEGLVLRSADYPDGHFLGWTPGQIRPALDDTLAWGVTPGSDLVVQLHLRPTGRIEDVAPSLALYFTDQPPRQRPVMMRLGQQTLRIPAGAAAFEARDAFVLPVAVTLHAIQPHAHFRARRVEARAVRPDGVRMPLLTIADWDARWQDRYRYRTPVHLPAGTRLETTYVFDNSADNPRNPMRPPATAEWGWRTSDEMGDVWFQLIAANEAERGRLERATRTVMQEEDARGCEMLLAREPTHVPLRNDAALLYMALGRPADALRHFEAVTRLEPQSAAAWFNEGVALEALRRPDEARVRYEQAVSHRPAYAAALNNLGALSLRQGRPTEAEPLFARAVAADEAGFEARGNLALAQALAGKPDEAFRTAAPLVASPDVDVVRRLIPLARLLAASPEASVRRPALARDLATRVVTATDRMDADALDVLAVALAAGGMFDEAVRTAEAAVARAGAAEAAEIRERLRLYRNRQPFVMAR